VTHDEPLEDERRALLGRLAIGDGGKHLRPLAPVGRELGKWLCRLSEATAIGAEVAKAGARGSVQ
jgi:hypothetical protein